MKKLHSLSQKSVLSVLKAVHNAQSCHLRMSLLQRWNYSQGQRSVGLVVLLQLVHAFNSFETLPCVISQFTTPTLADQSFFCFLSHTGWRCNTNFVRSARKGRECPGGTICCPVLPLLAYIQYKWSTEGSNATFSPKQAWRSDRSHEWNSLLWALNECEGKFTMI